MSKKINTLIQAVVLICVAFILTAQAQTPTITYNVAQESYAGMDSGVAWQSVYLLTDGRIASFGTGNHAPEQSNAMRIIDPVTNPGTVTSYDLFPWTQSGGVDLYVSNYDNHPSIYIPSENKAVWAGHGVFDFVQKSWTYGNRSPSTQGWTAFMADQFNMPTVYNPTVAWSTQLDVGVWFGGSAGGNCEGCTLLRIIQRNSGSGTPWIMTSVDLGSQGVEGFNRSRNTAVCIGSDLYLAGAKANGTGNGLYKINLVTKTRTATLAPYPVVSGEYFPQMVYDSRRNHLVVLGMRVFDYDIATNTWADVTPGSWPGYTNPMGVYHPGLDAIFFRGMPQNATDLASQLKWHKITFSGGGGSTPPPPTDTTSPTTSITSPLSGATVSSTISVSANASDNVGVVGVQFRLDGSNLGVEDTSAPYSVSWNTANSTSGTHTLTAVARDAAGNLATSASVSVTVSGTTSPPSGSKYRLITVDPTANPFKGPPDTSYGGSKHVWWVWNPVMKRVYSWGGDYGVGASSFGQPDMGSSFTAGSGRSYNRDSSLNNDQYSIDPYQTGMVRWRIEHPYLPRDINGTRELRPGRPDQSALVWDSLRSKFWGIYTVLRTEFLYYLPDGTPDLWANGEMTTTSPFEPIGTWSFAPNANGGVGQWTLETSARVAFRYGAGTAYNGNVLVTGSGDERIANWEYDPKTDRIVAFGVGRIFIFNPATKTYEHRVFSPAGYNYFNPCSSYVAIVGDWMYGVGMTNQSGTRKSQLIRVNIPNMLALANGASIPDSNSYWEPLQLPWSLSPGSVWESSNDASSKWQEHAGVMGVDGKVVVVKSYDGLVEDGVTKMTIWDPATRVFTPADPAPENLAANSWVALPDTGEVLFGLNTMGYTNSKLWAYKVSQGTTAPPSGTTPPSPPTNLQIQ